MEKLIAFIKQARQEKKTIVLVTGVFDLLHREHINFLKKAKQVGDILIVGVESDARVKKTKGERRPVEGQKQRQQKVVILKIADAVFVLPEKFNTPQQHLALLKIVRPQILAVSSHTPHLKEKRQLMKQVGGEVRVVYEQNLEISTTQLKQKFD